MFQKVYIRSQPTYVSEYNTSEFNLRGIVSESQAIWRIGVKCIVALLYNLCVVNGNFEKVVRAAFTHCLVFLYTVVYYPCHGLIKKLTLMAVWGLEVLWVLKRPRKTILRLMSKNWSCFQDLALPMLQSFSYLGHFGSPVNPASFYSISSPYFGCYFR